MLRSSFRKVFNVHRYFFKLTKVFMMNISQACQKVTK